MLIERPELWLSALVPAVVFAPHDITGDPPFTRISLVSCRNLLIYLDQTLQQRVLAAEHHVVEEAVHGRGGRPPAPR